jgi:hypothetical protein
MKSCELRPIKSIKSTHVVNPKNFNSSLKYSRDSTPMQRIFKTVQKLSGLSPTVSFTRSKQTELFKYTSGRWLYNEEERG